MFLQFTMMNTTNQHTIAILVAQQLGIKIVPGTLVARDGDCWVRAALTQAIHRQRQKRILY